MPRTFIQMALGIAICAAAVGASRFVDYERARILPWLIVFIGAVGIAVGIGAFARQFDDSVSGLAKIIERFRRRNPRE